MIRSAIHRDLRTPKYKPRVTPNKKRKLSKRACRNPIEPRKGAGLNQEG